MRLIVSVRALVVGGSLFAVTIPLLAQPTVEVGASFGIYAPIGDFAPAQYYTTQLPSTAFALAHIAIGGQLRVWFAPSFGLQLEAASTGSTKEGGENTPAGCCTPTTYARVVNASAQVMWAFAEPNNGRLWLSGGISRIQHGGTTYAPFGSPTNVGTVLALGTSLPTWGSLHFQASYSMLFYTMNVRDQSGVAVESGMQADAILSTGLSFALR